MTRLRFTVLLTPDERRMLDELAAGEHRTASEWVRVAILLAHQRKQIEAGSVATTTGPEPADKELT